MALARSASGPGGLSINTGSANSIFGSGGSSSASQAPATGGLFGGTKPSGGLFSASTATTSAPQPGLFSGAQTGGLFGSVTASQPQQTGGLFGSSTTTAQPQQGGGLFGSGSVTSLPQQTGSLFGNVNNASQPSQTGGLFGSSSTSQPQQSGGLFGGVGAQPAQNPGATTGGLFGGNTSTQQTGGLFGGMNNQNKPAPLFGQSTNHGQPLQQPASSLFGGGLTMGQNQASTQPPVPGVRIDLSNLRTTTRFNDIHESLQKEIEAYDTFILKCIRSCDDINAIMPSHAEQLAFIPNNVEWLSRRLNGVESSLEGDAEAVAHVSKLVLIDAENAKLSFRATDNLKLPPQYHHQGIWNAKSPSDRDGNRDGAQDLVSFFSRTADEMEGTVSKYQASITEIEQHLRAVEASTMHQASQMGGSDQGENMRELAAVLREFEEAVVGVAGSVGEAREKVQKLQLGEYADAMHVNGNGKRSGVY